MSGEYECKNEVLRIYNEKCQELMKNFKIISMKHIPREQNIEANDLAHGASGYKSMLEDVETNIFNVDADDWKYEIIEYLKNSSQSA